MRLLGRIFDLFKLEITRETERNSTSFSGQSIIISQYSSMPRYYTIDGIKYDIDNPRDIERLPLFGNIIYINGEEYGMDSVLRKHAYESYLENKAIYNAAIEKENEFKEHGFYFETEEEKRKKREYEEDQKRKREEEKAVKRLHDSFKIEDMHQFTEIPFEWHWVMELQHTNGIAWFMLNRNNQYIALSAINYINSVLEGAEAYTGFRRSYYICTENIDFDYPRPMKKDSLPNTFVRCVPYTKTGRISKYPAILCFKEYMEGKVMYARDMPINTVHGSVCFMRDGNIGMADITIHEYWIQIRLHGISLVVQRIGKNTEKGNVDIYRKKI